MVELLKQMVQILGKLTEAKENPQRTSWGGDLRLMVSKSFNQHALNVGAHIFDVIVRNCKDDLHQKKPGKLAVHQRGTGPNTLERQKSGTKAGTITQEVQESRGQDRRRCVS